MVHAASCARTSVGAVVEQRNRSHTINNIFQNAHKQMQVYLKLPLDFFSECAIRKWLCHQNRSNSIPIAPKTSSLTSLFCSDGMFIVGYKPGCMRDGKLRQDLQRFPFKSPIGGMGGPIEREVDIP